jgi:hypothetical protein
MIQEEEDKCCGISNYIYIYLFIYLKQLIYNNTYIYNNCI